MSTQQFHSQVKFSAAPIKIFITTVTTLLETTQKSVHKGKDKGIVLYHTAITPPISVEDSHQQHCVREKNKSQDDTCRFHLNSV